MSEETTASAPAEAQTTTVDEGAAGALEAASAPDGGVTIEGTAEPGADTVMIGDVAVPLAALADLPDDVLRGITRTVKVNGEERQVSIADALQAVSKAEGADAKMREAARQRKQAEAALAAVLDDPLTAIGKIAEMNGSTREEARQLLEAKLLEQFEYESLDPAEREKRDAEREMRRKAEAFERYQQEEAKRQAEAQHRQHVETLQSQLTEAVTQANVPAVDRPHVFHRAVAIMQGAVAARGGDIPQAELGAAMQKAVARAAEELSTSRGAMFEIDDDEALLSAIPEHVQKRIARAYGAKVKRSAPTPRRPSNGKPAEAPQRKMTTQEWREWLAERDAAAGR